MKPGLKLTPAQLVLASLLGFVILAGSLPLIRFVHPKDASDCFHWAPALFVFSLFILGMVISIKASGALKKGIRNQQWPEEQLEPLYSCLESSLFNALPIMLLATYGALWLIYPRYRMFGLAAFLLVQILSQLRSAIRRPPTQSSSLIANWRGQLAPIRSDYWGHR